MPRPLAAEDRRGSTNLSEIWSRDGTLVDSSSDFELEDGRFLKGNVKSLLRKIDLNLMPIISVLYLLSCLDRSNLGNASENGLTKDLHMTGKNDFNSFPGLLVTRSFLGLVQGGVFPGIVYFISMWYQSHECGLRIAMFYSVAVAGTSFNGLIGNGILNLQGVAGLDGWQWLFIIEGAITFIIALVAFKLMQDYPKTATFLTKSERRVVLQRLDEEQSSMPKEFRMKYIKDALLDWKIWVHMVITLGVSVPQSSISQFLPGIIEDLGYKGAHAKLMGIPPHIAAAVFVIGGGFAADRHEQRGIYIIGFCIVGMIGFLLLAAVEDLVIEYMSTFLIAIGTYPIVPQDLAWNANNIGGTTKRAVGIAMHIGFGNLGGAIAGFIIRENDARRFVSGHGVLLGMMGMSCVLTIVMTWYCRRENQARASRQYPRLSTIQERLRERERGDRASFFVLTT
ncbi:hypothetical protein QQS21_002329 [Conoideocrella luteorostrata]|uniref:Uncharacterized protein n=1 Tax=Conoideocrella luteorostrata TaxID=1105319 RepID=A0AAJ0CZF1_9HYPO|nr:hypothetical protein QQS21_002329 [Conoideocrella luteorostrata]